MPIQEFALDAAGTKRVQVFQETDLARGNLTVLLDRTIIGTISQEELITGREFPLTDGSILKVQLVNNQVQVLRNGQPLLPFTKPKLVLPSPIPNRFLVACGAVFLIGALNIVFGLVSTLSQNQSSAQRGLGIGILVVGILFLLLGFFVVRKSRVALGIAVTLYGLDAILNLCLGNLTAVLLHILLLFALIGGFSAIRKMDEIVAAQLAD